MGLEEGDTVGVGEHDVSRPDHDSAHRDGHVDGTLEPEYPCRDRAEAPREDREIVGQSLVMVIDRTVDDSTDRSASLRGEGDETSEGGTLPIPAVVDDEHVTRSEQISGDVHGSRIQVWYADGDGRADELHGPPVRHEALREPVVAQVPESGHADAAEFVDKRRVDLVRHGIVDEHGGSFSWFLRGWG